MLNTPLFNFASRMQIKRIYVQKQSVKVPAQGLSLAFPGSENKAKVVSVKNLWKRARVDNQPTPVKDFINFKQMSGNEIILNLENHTHFVTSELLGGLLALAKHDRNYEFNWNNHPVTAMALSDLKSRIGYMNSKHLIQTCLVLDKL